ncbi:MAG: phosphomannomutase [bacterium]|nr:phosphomannomutase [bacterium]
MLSNFADTLPAFKAYDIRGRVPQELNEESAMRIGQAFAYVLRPKKVVIGYDIRLSSPALTKALSDGLNQFGVEVTNIGLCGTEEIYFACGKLDFDGGIMVTASHNPKEYNGIKMVMRGARPLCQENGLAKIRELTTQDWDPEAALEQMNVTSPGQTVRQNIHEEFIDYVLNLVDLEAIKKANLTVIANAGNGGAGVVLERLKGRLPIKLHILNGEPDGNFPHGIPNPLLPENRDSTSKAVLQCKAGLGAAWDGDFDRCFFFDENGRFIEGYYLVGLFASRFLQKFPGASIIHDPRLYWNTCEIAQQCHGQAIVSKTGHAFIKQAMRQNNAVYGGEMSAHQYFKDFFYCDGGILPWLTLMEFMGLSGCKLSQLVDKMMERYPVSGEINYKIAVKPEVIFAKLKDTLEKAYGTPVDENYLDGLSLEYANFRLNLRASNTEPLLRLNVETRADQPLVNKIVEIVENCIKSFAN